MNFIRSDVISFYVSKKNHRTSLELQPLFRTVEFDRASADAESRTVPLSFSSETPVERWFGEEILDHKPGSVRMDRLNAGAPLLLCHDRRDQVGVVDSAEVKDGKGRAVVRFSKSARGQEIFQDVMDGIRKTVSVGYRVHKMQLEKEDEGRETYRVTSWEPFEISLEPIPADASVGVGRASEEPSTKVTIEIPESMKRNILLDPAPTDGGGGSPALSGAKVVDSESVLAAERKRVADIHNIAKRHEITGDMLDKAVAEGISADQFGMRVLEAKGKVKPVEAKEPGIGLSDKETRSFSLMRAVRSIITHGRLDGFEKEVSDAAAKQYRIADLKEGSIIMPDEVVQRHTADYLAKRAQNVTTSTAGGFTVATMLGSLIEYLRNDTVLGRLGVTDLTGLVGDLAYPVQTGGATAYWLSETGAITDSEATFSQKSLTPHRLGASIPFTTQFLAQTSIGAEAFLNQELMTVLGIELDRAGLHGSGVSGQPLGVANTTDINATVTYGGAAVWADVVEHETGITADNAAIGDMAFALSSATVGKWKTILKDSVAGADYLINSMNGTANGYRVERTNQISGNVSFFGVWRQLLRASWAGREVIVDPYALKKSGQVEITVNEFHDYLVRQPLAFNVSTDSAAQ